jgi:hypothetical protein
VGPSTRSTVGAMDVTERSRALGQGPSEVPFTPMADPRTVNTDTGGWEMMRNKTSGVEGGGVGGYRLGLRQIRCWEQADAD